jgi:predicted DNA-binding transcriptional regulator YafY
MLRFLTTHPKGLTVTMLSRALKAKVRTIYRDLEILRAVGFNVCTDRHGRESLHYVPHFERQELKSSLRVAEPEASKHPHALV